MTCASEALHAFRAARESGSLRPMLERVGADVDSLEQEAADLAATDVTPAEAFVMGVMTAALAQTQFAFIMELPSTDPTEATGPRRVRPGIRRRGR